MVNNVQKNLGYRDIIYNIQTNEFWTTAPGDNYTKLEIAGGGSIPIGDTGDRPAEPNIGDIFFDITTGQLIVWTGSEWAPVGGENITVNSGPTANRPAPSIAEQGMLFYDTTINELLVYDGSNWVSVSPDEIAVLEEIVLQDKSTGAEVVLSIRNGALIVTDPFTESVSEIDLGGTTPDPGTLTNVYLDGTGRYAVGASTLNNANGLATLEYINTPGQFFVINDIDGGVFGPGDRQSFGLVRETIYDGTDLGGGVLPFSGGNSGGWSISYSWFYTGGYPYGWTTYATPNQTPGGSGMNATGAMAGQTLQRQWWDLAGRAGVGKSLRVGIANGTLTQADGADFSNRLVIQLYFSQEMVDHPDFASLAPAVVQSNGVGWYTQSATAGNYENMGSFDNGQDKGYRFRWSTFGNTALSQLPFVTGVSNNDQITAASGNSHYIVYNCAPGDFANANGKLAQGLIGPHNRLWPESTVVDVLQFQQPYDFPNTPPGNVFELKYTYVAAVLASPLFVNYPVSTVEQIIETGISVAPLEKLHQNVCEEIRQAVTAYYLVRDFDAVDTGLVNAKLADATFAALGGQLINTYDAVFYTDPDDDAPEGSSGDVLFPVALKTAILEKLELWMNTLPDN